MKQVSRYVVVAALVVSGLTLAVIRAGSAGSDSSTPGNQVIAHAVAEALGQEQARPHEQPISDGMLYGALQATGHFEQQANEHPGSQGLHASGPSRAGTQGCQNRFEADGIVTVRVNQDCSLRRQAEEVVAINPQNENNLVAGQNDSRVGFNHCGYDWSFDGGKTWGDQIPPFYQFTALDGHTFDACSDPTATFDAA